MKVYENICEVEMGFGYVARVWFAREREGPSDAHDQQLLLKAVQGCTFTASDADTMEMTTQLAHKLPRVNAMQVSKRRAPDVVAGSLVYLDWP